ncbi:MAG: mannosyltransferase family protein [bacterium]|nr:mannosyltransferase family protein [bacterium]
MRWIKTVLVIFVFLIVWITSLQLLAYLGTNRLHLAPDTAYQDMNPRIDATDSQYSLIRNWQRFDSYWYLSIANHGYFYQKDIQSSVVFFPLYPMLMSLLSPLTHGNTALAGIALSLLFAFLSCLLLYRLALFEFDEATAWRSIVFLLVFPTSFFLISLYTESLFVFLSLLTFYLARKQHWWLAGLAGIFLTATRFAGIAIVIPLIWEYLRQHTYHWRVLIAPKILSIIIIPCGLLLFMGYLQGSFGNPLLFLEAQENWQRNFELSKTGVEKAFDTYVKEFETVKDVTDSTPLTTRYIDVMFTILFIVSVIIAWFVLPKPYALFATLLLIIPLLSGRLQSMPRYALSAFPLFLVYARLSRHPLVFSALVILCTFALALFSIMFVSYYWVA